MMSGALGLYKRIDINYYLLRLLRHPGEAG